MELPRFLRSCRFYVLLLALLQGTMAQAWEMDWEGESDRQWIGSDFWANRLQDWRVENGKLQCVAKPMLPMRTAHLLTQRLHENPGPFKISVVASELEMDGRQDGRSEAGFLIGAGGQEMDYRAAAIIHHWAGPGGGIYVGADAGGNVFIRDNTESWEISPIQDESRIRRIEVTGAPENESFRITVEAFNDLTDESFSKATQLFDPKRIAGNIALVSNSRAGGLHNTFSRFSVNGPGIKAHPGDGFGPVVSTQFTVSRGVLKMTAQMVPIGEEEPHRAFLEVQKGDDWEEVADAGIVVPGWTATFRVDGWDASEVKNYRVVYKDAMRGGIIPEDPGHREMVVAGFTGNHNNSHQIGAKDAPTDWVSGMWFPHADMTEKVAQHAPDLLFFSGDQVYEGKSPTFPDRENINLDYLYKWYMWCWAWRDLTGSVPSVTIPDDHDVYQGNIWGQGGRPIYVDNAGGYVHPADFVKMVHRTQTDHLPDPYDPEPVEQGIPVYYTSLNWGRTSFAILEDRKWKSGCSDHGLPPSGTGRPDHFNNEEFDTRQLDLPGLKLLGNRQLEFLEDWSTDWKGADMKVALSQTIFGNMATHHGPGLDYLMADLDSNGWPQSGRNRAIDALRKSFTFHLAGDQHLATIVHHGIDNHGDAIWSFCVPSVANFYPRMWMPKREGLNRPEGAPHWQGDHFDGFRNLVTVYAATNPGPDFGIEPLELHNRMPGYGIVRLRPETREIVMECWPRFADPMDPSAQYPGWPKTITQQDNYAREPGGYLAPMKVSGMSNPVVEIRKADSNELVYSLRVDGDEFTPWVFEEGRYDVRIGEPEEDNWIELQSLPAELEPYGETRLIEF